METYPSIYYCGINEVQKIINPSFTYLISIYSIEDILVCPGWIQPANHLELYFEDIVDPFLAYGQYYAPSKKDIEKLLGFGRKILTEQDQHLKPIKTLIHCSAGRSRSAAASFVLLCDWYGQGQEKRAASEIKTMNPLCHPNTYMVKLADEIMNRNGKLIQEVNGFN
jgi:predicted protein tyrosine phosphatase